MDVPEEIIQWYASKMSERTRNYSGFAGSLAAFEELVKRYEKKIYTLDYRYSGNYDDAFKGDLQVILQRTCLFP